MEVMQCTCCYLVMLQCCMHTRLKSCNCVMLNNSKPSFSTMIHYILSQLSSLQFYTILIQMFIF